MMSLELRVLNYFLMVAQEENITKAAHLLHVTQPTLSRQLMQLEEELGVKLFRRSSHNIILTEAGLLLKRRARELISLADKTKREFIRAEETGGEITIGSGELQSTKLLSRIMADFRRQNPNVSYELYSGNTDNIRERIDGGGLDLGLLFRPADIGKYDFITMPVREEWGVLVNRDSPLAEKEAVVPADLKGKSLIFSGRELLKNEIMGWLGRYGSDVEVAARGNLLYNMAILAENRLGVVITVRLDCEYEGLKFVPMRPAIATETVLVWKKGQTFSPAAEMFIQYAVKYIESMSENTI